MRFAATASARIHRNRRRAKIVWSVAVMILARLRRQLIKTARPFFESIVGDMLLKDADRLELRFAQTS